MANDAMGDRMKSYEMVEAGRRFLPLPIIARLDGKRFSSFTRGMTRPYDERMSRLMVVVTDFLVRETNASCGYTQSDEITLTWYANSRESQIYFDGRVQKMTSVLAAMCSVQFNRHLPNYFPDKVDQYPVFDCRVWQLPSLEEAANTFLWREFDATKNSIQMAAQSVYSHNELMNKHGGQMQEMLFQKGINWNDYPDFFKRGTYVRRRKIKSRMSVEDLERLPPLHEARKNPDLEIERTEYVVGCIPVFNRVTNRVGVVFEGEEPMVETK